MAKKRLIRRNFVTIQSIGGYCMVSTTTVRRWIKDGKLQATKLPGGHFRVTVEDLMDFLKQNGIPFDNALMAISVSFYFINLIISTVIHTCPVIPDALTVVLG